MIDLRRPGQCSFGEGLIEEETANLWEPWMRHADQVLEDERLVKAVYEALLKRRPKSRTRGDRVLLPRMRGSTQRRMSPRRKRWA